MKLVALLLALLLVLPSSMAGAWQEAPVCSDLVYLEQIYKTVQNDLALANNSKVDLANALYDMVLLRWELISKSLDPCVGKTHVQLVMWMDLHMSSALLGIAQTLDAENDRYAETNSGLMQSAAEREALLEAAFE